MTVVVLVRSSSSFTATQLRRRQPRHLRRNHHHRTTKTMTTTTRKTSLSASGAGEAQHGGKLFMGMDFGTSGCRVSLIDERGVQKFETSVKYTDTREANNKTSSSLSLIHI